MNENRTSRRSVLKAGAAATAASLGGLAGCIGSPTDDSADDAAFTGYGNFFAVWDWARHVGGDEVSFENPVETGEMGHGWSPDGDLTGRIAGTEVFFYLDTPEFSWAQNVARGLERDYDDVHVVDLLQGMEPFLIPFDQDDPPEPDPNASTDTDDIQWQEWDIYDITAGQQLGYWHNDHWHGGVPDVLLGASATVGVALPDSQGRVLPLGDDESYRLAARVPDGHDDIVTFESHGDRIEIHGDEPGQTAIVFEFIRDGEVVYDTSNDPSTFEVVEEFDEDGAQDFHDPHTWVDPVLVERMVDRIADELAELDPDNEELYRDNAEEYNERVMGVHEQLEQVIEDADTDQAVFAAHDSFQYVERRYDFELHTPTGITPDASPSTEDISDLIEVIERNGINTILYDPFEAPNPDEDLPNLVEVLHENSSAESAEPLTPAEGTTQSWSENDWGWVELMEEINIPSLEAALNP